MNGRTPHRVILSEALSRGAVANGVIAALLIISSCGSDNACPPFTPAMEAQYQVALSLLMVHKSQLEVRMAGIVDADKNGRGEFAGTERLLSFNENLAGVSGISFESSASPMPKSLSARSYRIRIYLPKVSGQDLTPVATSEGGEAETKYCALAIPEGLESLHVLSITQDGRVLMSAAHAGTIFGDESQDWEKLAREMFKGNLKNWHEVPAESIEALRNGLARFLQDTHDRRIRK